MLAVQAIVLARVPPVWATTTTRLSIGRFRVRQAIVPARILAAWAAAVPARIPAAWAFAVAANRTPRAIGRHIIVLPAVVLKAVIARRAILPNPWDGLGVGSMTHDYGEER